MFMYPPNSLLLSHCPDLLLMPIQPLYPHKVTIWICDLGWKIFRCSQFLIGKGSKSLTWCPNLNLVWLFPTGSLYTNVLPLSWYPSTWPSLNTPWSLQTLLLDLCCFYCLKSLSIHGYPSVIITPSPKTPSQIVLHLKKSFLLPHHIAFINIMCL